MIYPPDIVRRFTSRRPARAGFSLLELILALALSVLVLAAVSMAVHLHVFSLNMGRAQVEESQLARAVLQKISDDLRGAVYFEPFDPPQLKGSQSGGGSSSDSPEGEAPPSGDPLAGDPMAGDPIAGDADDDSGVADEDADEQTLDIANATAVMSQPGLVGDQYTLQIDVGRLPRVDQYRAMIASISSGELTDVPSDVKTVAYYLKTQESRVSSDTAGQFGDNSGFFEFSGGTGLVRRELDYSVTRWAAESGQTQQLEQSGRLLAAEIVYLAFRYFDGTEWLSEWNSEDQGGLPRAVEITLVVASQRRDDRFTGGSASLAAGQQTSGQTYIKIVHLPSSVLPSSVAPSDAN